MPGPDVSTFGSLWAQHNGAAVDDCRKHPHSSAKGLSSLPTPKKSCDQLQMIHWVPLNFKTLTNCPSEQALQIYIAHLPNWRKCQNQVKIFSSDQSVTQNLLFTNRKKYVLNCQSSLETSEAATALLSEEGQSLERYHKSYTRRYDCVFS